MAGAARLGGGGDVHGAGEALSVGATPLHPYRPVKLFPLTQFTTQPPVINYKHSKE